MKKKRKLKQTLLLGLASVMFLIVLGISSYMLTFLVSKITSAFDVEIKKPTVVKFDTEGFEQLHLIKK
ncbi:MAG: hypothetical protein AB1333_02580 [Patescibacteria group bacterium]